MQSFDDPTIGQEVEQMTSIHDSGDAVQGQLDPASSGSQWLDFLPPIYSVNDTFAPELFIPGKYQHQHHSDTYAVTQSPAVESVSHDATSSASFRIEGSGSNHTVNPPQAADDPDNGNITTGFFWSDTWTWEDLLEISPRRPQLSGHLTQSEGKKPPYSHQCPVCEQSFKRRDNIKPHISRKHPSYYSLHYATSRPASPHSSSVLTQHQIYSSGEASSVDDLRCDINPTNRLSLEQELKTPDQLQWEGGLSGASMMRRKRSLSNPSLDTASAVSDGSLRRAGLSRNYSRNDSGRKLACPFLKRDPSKNEKCFSLSLNRIKDVKQHIYRCHVKPEYYCASCYEVFDTADDRDKHSRQRGCKALDGPCLPQFEGITEDQKKMLGEKSLRTLGVEDQWFQIWSIIFPECAPPKSAFFGSYLEEMAPILRSKWERQRSSIVALAGGEGGSQQLSRAMDRAMDLFLKSIESPKGEISGEWTIQN